MTIHSIYDDSENIVAPSESSRKRKDGTYQDVAHPLNNETREMIEKEVISRYEEELKKEEKGIKRELSRDEKEIKPEPPTEELEGVIEEKKEKEE